jgi:hypothetical protein
MDVIKGVMDKVASRKLAVTATAYGGGYGRGRDHLTGGYCGRGVYHWSGVGRYVGRLRRGRGQREAGRL